VGVLPCTKGWCAVDVMYLSMLQFGVGKCAFVWFCGDGVGFGGGGRGEGDDGRAEGWCIVFRGSAVIARKHKDSLERQHKDLRTSHNMAVIRT